MHKLFSCGLILAIVFSPLRSLPILDPSEISFRIPASQVIILRWRRFADSRLFSIFLLIDSKMDFGDVSSWDDTHLLQNLPSFLDKGRDIDIDTDDIFGKEGLSLGTYNMDNVMKEEWLDKQPHMSLLSRLQSKERKPYKKRAGNLSECFWKYCV
ncbi:urotensin-2-like [Bufo bufo]|uniref:urotensin-2-like n=1 Tax=Bufo bufo TaxID=8384 RepID=UPI001ABE8708|nr:urotensin-2-like [Bufo bufo]